MKRLLLILIAIAVSTASYSQTKQQLAVEQFQSIADSIQKVVSPLATVYGRITVDTVYVYPDKRMDIHFSRALSEFPLRDSHIKTIYSITKGLVPEGFGKYDIHLFSSRTSLEELSSPYYSGRTPAFKPKKEKKAQPQNKWVSSQSLPYTIDKGLQSNHIALWQSHGYYYEQKLLRWEWQRARIFQTVEDLYTQSYVLPFLVPMLENAGAYVILPRERDSQTWEVIVDNDEANDLRFHGLYEEKADGNNVWSNTSEAGFADKQGSYGEEENPFAMGTARYIKTIKSGTASTAKWSPEIPESGEYAVYVSYKTLPNSTDAAHYTVVHNGGKSEFIVNQKIGGSTWVYLGTFSFASAASVEGNEEFWQGVILDNATPSGYKYIKDAVVSADAVKIGGGMGNIARKPGIASTENLQSASPAANGKRGAKPIATGDVPKNHSDFSPLSEISGYPRYTEGARYWLQWAGFADTVYSPNHNMNDYNDDYMSRGRWVNVLSGGSKVNPEEHGYGVPLDMAMAFHSDAGTTLTDSIIGTLAIYTRYSEGKDLFPTGEPRIVSRELADMIQTQIVEDVKAIYEPNWIRRGTWDRSYSESRTPVVPTMLLELLSHQNFADMRYGLDPSFRFTVSRAIYKAILRFLSQRTGKDYQIQPLPVNSFAAVLSESNEGKPVAKLSWKEVLDPSETSAAPSQYIVYTRVSNPESPETAGFDNGVSVGNATTANIPIEPGKIYSFKVVAANAGGASFPSEILSVGIAEGWKDKYTVMVMNGFDRVSAPASYATRDSMRAGFDNYLDGGVPYKKDFSFIGNMHEYRREIPWMDDDAPGFGASYANYENKVIAGNTFDYPLTHGIAIMASGYNFVSASRDAVTAGYVKLNDYPIVDMIMGKQVKVLVGKEGGMAPKYEVFPILLQKAIKDYCQKGGNLLISGSYVASDIWDKIYREAPKESERKEVSKAINSVQGISSQLESIISDIYMKSGNVQRYNDSLGFSYFNYDSVAVSKITGNLNTSAAFIDSIVSSLRSAYANISKFERGTDKDELSKVFAQDVLKFRWMTHYASATGEVKPVQNPFGIGYQPIPMGKYSFETTPNKDCYAVESPDGLVPVGENAWTVYRYADNNISAGVAYKGEDYKCITLGFPIEALMGQMQINTIMSDLLKFFSE